MAQNDQTATPASRRQLPHFGPQWRHEGFTRNTQKAATRTSLGPALGMPGHPAPGPQTRQGPATQPQVGPSRHKGQPQVRGSQGEGQPSWTPPPQLSARRAENQGNRPVGAQRGAPRPGHPPRSLGRRRPQARPPCLQHGTVTGTRYSAITVSTALLGEQRLFTEQAYFSRWRVHCCHVRGS